MLYLQEGEPMIDDCVQCNFDTFKVSYNNPLNDPNLLLRTQPVPNQLFMRMQACSSCSASVGQHNTNCPPATER